MICKCGTRNLARGISSNLTTVTQLRTANRAFSCVGKVNTNHGEQIADSCVCRCNTKKCHLTSSLRDNNRRLDFDLVTVTASDANASHCNASHDEIAKTRKSKVVRLIHCTVNRESECLRCSSERCTTN